MKHLATILTGLRILGALLLLLTPIFSVVFWVFYILCYLTDALDGMVARLTKSESKLGEMLDSLADFILLLILFFKFIPFFSFKKEIVYWIIMIALCRFLSWIIGFVKYRTFSSLHTWANKITGFIIALFPLLYVLEGSKIMFIVICSFSSLSAIEELVIIVKSKQLDRNIKSLFSK